MAVATMKDPLLTGALAEAVAKVLDGYIDQIWLGVLSSDEHS